MIRIMFVCTGNICRSPMAELVMKQLVRKEGLDWVISSAAMADLSIHPKNRYPSRCISASVGEAAEVNDSPVDEPAFG